MVTIIAEAFDVYAGDSWSQSFEIGTLEGEVFTGDDLSGWAEWTCDWRPADSSATEIELTVDSSDAATGVIVVSATPAQTRAMGVSGVFDIQGANGTTEVRTFVRAKTKWKLDVTRVGA